MVKREPALAEIQKQGGLLRKGELELKIIPELVKRDKDSERRPLSIIHYEDINLLKAMRAVKDNARIAGYLERSFLPRKGWFIQMARRYLLRVLLIRKASRYTFIDSSALALMGLSSFFGVIIGRYFGIGDAELELANAHPTIE
jgi:hypothetical protein